MLRVRNGPPVGPNDADRNETLNNTTKTRTMSQRRRTFSSQSSDDKDEFTETSSRVSFINEEREAPLSDSCRCSASLRPSLSSSWWRSWQRLRVSNFVVIFAVLCFLSLVSSETHIIEDHSPKIIIKSDELSSQSFHGNHSHVDYFRLLQRDGDSILIGARNIVYNISIYDLSEHYDRRIMWYSRQVDSDTCFSKGKSESECQNYIRVLAKKDEGRFLVCGTNAYKPLCRDYALQVDGKFAFNESSGIGKCPYNPRHNSTFVFAEGQLYSGTVADFQGTVPLIFREPLKTDHSDFRHLNAPDFVHSFSYGPHVFFFFRETAVEYMNCGKRVFSRVARVCKDDRGAAQQRYDSMWTSFLKSRLNCSFPGDFPFYFDEIQSVSDVIRGEYAGSLHEIIYAIFTTPENSIPGSAICAFSMRDILDAFEGPFKEQKDLHSNWLPLPNHVVPEPRPGACVNDSRTLTEENINFARFHPLMDELVPPFTGQPLLMKASFNYRFTKLAVDPQVPLVTGGFMDVLFIATNNGIILKAVNAVANKEMHRVSPVIIEEIRVFDFPVSINNLQIAKQSNGESKLIIITDSEVKAIALERCSTAKSCGECLSLQDPYCGWYPKLSRCDSTQRGLKQIVMQNVSSGTHKSCPYSGENLIHQPSTQVYTTEVPPPITTAETCPPCICDVSTTSTTTERPERIARPTEGNFDRSNTANEEDNEIDPRAVPQGNHPSYTQYISNNIPPIPPQRTRGSGRVPSVSRRGKEFKIALETSLEEGAEEESTYSEGVTGPVVGASMKGPLIYSAETLAIAVTTACVAALVVGFISGFLFSRKCRGDDYPHFSGTPYLDSKLNKCDNLVPCADPNMYTANNVPPAKQINNLVTNFNPKNVNNGKTNTNTTTVDGKLIKPAKCAYI